MDNSRVAMDNNVALSKVYNHPASIDALTVWIRYNVNAANHPQGCGTWESECDSCDVEKVIFFQEFTEECFTAGISVYKTRRP